MSDANIALWAAIEDCDNPMLADFEPPFMIYPRKDGVGFVLQEQMRFREDGIAKAIQVLMTQDAAMQLLGALDAYRQNKGLSIPRGEFLQRQ